MTARAHSVLVQGSWAKKLLGNSLGHELTQHVRTDHVQREFAHGDAAASMPWAWADGDVAGLFRGDEGTTNAGREDGNLEMKRERERLRARERKRRLRQGVRGLAEGGVEGGNSWNDGGGEGEGEGEGDGDGEDGRGSPYLLRQSPVVGEGNGGGDGTLQDRKQSESSSGSLSGGLGSGGQTYCVRCQRQFKTPHALLVHFASSSAHQVMIIPLSVCTCVCLHIRVVICLYALLRHDVSYCAHRVNLSLQTCII